MYDQRISAAKKIIQEHNSNVDKKFQTNVEEFINNLQEMGGTTAEAIKQCSWEDIERCGVPRLIAKQISRLFRQPLKDEKRKSSYVSNKKAERMTIEELIERYNPIDSTNAVAKKLKEKSKGNRFIIFNDDGSINVKQSTRLLRESMKGYPERNTCIIDWVPRKVYKVGDNPHQFAEENPLYPGRMLRSDGTCDQTGRSWNNVDNIIKQIIYISIKFTNELSISTINDAHQIIDLVMSSKDVKHIKSRFPQASIKYDELKEEGKLPTLRIRMNKNDQINENNDPFYSSNVF